LKNESLYPADPSLCGIFVTSFPSFQSILHLKHVLGAVHMVILHMKSVHSVVTTQCTAALLSIDVV